MMLALGFALVFGLPSALMLTVGDPRRLKEPAGGSFRIFERLGLAPRMTMRDVYVMAVATSTLVALVAVLGQIAGR